MVADGYAENEGDFNRLSCQELNKYVSNKTEIRWNDSTYIIWRRLGVIGENARSWSVLAMSQVAADGSLSDLKQWKKKMTYQEPHMDSQIAGLLLCNWGLSDSAKTRLAYITPKSTKLTTRISCIALQHKVIAVVAWWALRLGEPAISQKAL